MHSEIIGQRVLIVCVVLRLADFCGTVTYSSTGTATWLPPRGHTARVAACVRYVTDTGLEARIYPHTWYVQTKALCIQQAWHAAKGRQESEAIESENLHYCIRSLFHSAITSIDKYST
jgi:hypothetical protein